MQQTYSRSAPSPRYQELISLYATMHDHGQAEQGLGAESTFAGQSLFRQAPVIKQVVDKLQPQTILDYGAGKGLGYRTPYVAPDGSRHDSLSAYWGVDAVTCYDPGYAPYSALPDTTFDGVICTDVLEHCPEEDLGWILSELFGFARVFVFANIANYPAQKILPNGENAHCTVQPAGWWTPVIRDIARAYPTIRYMFVVETAVQLAQGESGIKSDLISG